MMEYIERFEFWTECDGPNCKESLSLGFQDGGKEAQEEAMEAGWKRHLREWFCPTCLSKGVRDK